MPAVLLVFLTYSETQRRTQETELIDCQNDFEFFIFIPISENINPQSLFIWVLLTKLLLQVTLKEQDTEVDLFFFFFKYGYSN